MYLGTKLLLNSVIITSQKKRISPVMNLYLAFFFLSMGLFLLSTGDSKNMRRKTNAKNGNIVSFGKIKVLLGLI